MSKEAEALQRTYIVPISVPPEFVEVADADKEALIQDALRLVDIIYKHRNSSKGVYWISTDGFLRKVHLGARPEDYVSATDLEDEDRVAGLIKADVINPAEDARFVLENVFHYRNGKKAEQTKDLALLETSRQMVKEASDKILARFGDHLSSEQRAILNLLYQGVNVIPKLKDTTQFDDNSSHYSNNSERVVVRGGVVKHYKAVNFDEDFLKSSEEQGRKMHTAVHEAMHTIEDNNLPLFLNEAITDDFANEVLGYSVNRQESMFESFNYVCEIWQRIKAQTSIYLIISAYTEPAVLKKTINTKSKKTVSVEYVDHPFHDEMRRIFGQNGKDFRWDKTLALIEDKKGREAYNYLFGK